MAHIEIRAAQPEDRAPVLAFCTQTWTWGDYIDRVWEEWLHDPHGKLLVATVDRQPAGVAHMTMLTPTDAWFQGLRVDPQFRQQGLAKALNEALQIEAMQRGATYARIAIHSENDRSIQIMELAHWRRVGAVALYHAEALTATPRRAMNERPQLATEDDLDEIIDFLNGSNIFPLVGGLYYLRFQAVPITEELLKEKIAQQHIYILRRWERLDGLAIAEFAPDAWSPRRLSIGYIDGTAIEPISMLAYDLLRRAAEMELDNIRIYAPDLVLVRDALTGVGYEAESELYYSYEKGLF